MNISDIPIYEQCKQLETENAELKAEIETLKKVKDFACINLKNYIADNDKLKAENERLKEEIKEVKKYQYQQEYLDKEIAELKAYKDVNEDFKIAWEELKAENARLKEELTTYGATGVCEVCSDKANKLADKYLGCLQEIKEIAKMDICSNCVTQKREDNCQCLADTILQLITKVESEG